MLTDNPPPGAETESLGSTKNSPTPPSEETSKSSSELVDEAGRLAAPSPEHVPPVLPPGVAVYEYRLPPRIPDAWLSDLKNAIKESRTKLIVTTILTSSLLTGLLGTVGNLYLEDHKSKLQISRDSANAGLAAYTLLGSDIQELETRVIAARIICLKTASDPSEHNSERAIEEISALSEQLAIVQNRVKHQDIDNGRGTRELVERWLTPLGEKLEAAQKHSNSKEILKDLVTALDSLKQGIGEIKNHINSKKTSLRETL